jgi:hypothetical protein
MVFQNLKFNDKRLSKIYFPSYLEEERKIYFENITDAYFIVVNDFVFFSKDYKALINLLNKQSEQKNLKDNKLFKEIYGRIRSRSNINFYFNLQAGLPEFLNNGSFISEIIKLYEKGMFGVNFENNNISIDFASSGINVRKVSVYPGFPKKMIYPATTGVVCDDIKGDQNYEFIFGTSDNKINLMNNSNELLKGYPVFMGGTLKEDPIIVDLDKDGKKEIYALTENGFFHRFDFEGNEVYPFPIKLNFKPAFNPVILNDKFLFYSKNDKKFFVLDNDNFIDSDIILPDYLNSQIAVSNNFIAFSTKNSTKTINLLDANGKVMNGWPKETGNDGNGSPVIDRIGFDTKPVIIFLTQNGNLNVWKTDSNNKNGFPVQLTGAFNRQPEIGYFERDDIRKIITVSDEGVLTILSDKGEIVKEKKIKELNSRNNKMLLYDVNRDGLTEVFIYGSNNLIYALDSKLNIMPGFPVKGNSKPCFCDLNSDGEYEMITSGLDNNLYIYSIPRF